MSNAVKLMLTRGRALLKGCGWIKGTVGNMEEGFCTIGALQFVRDKAMTEVPSEDDRQRAYEDALACLRACAPAQWLAIRRHESSDADVVIGFNDYVSTRKEDVIDMFDCAEGHAPDYWYDRPDFAALKDIIKAKVASADASSEKPKDEEEDDEDEEVSA